MFLKGYDDCFAGDLTVATDLTVCSRAKVEDAKVQLHLVFHTSCKGADVYFVCKLILFFSHTFSVPIAFLLHSCLKMWFYSLLENL